MSTVNTRPKKRTLSKLNDSCQHISLQLFHNDIHMLPIFRKAAHLKNNHPPPPKNKKKLCAPCDKTAFSIGTLNHLCTYKKCVSKNLQLYFTILLVYAYKRISEQKTYISPCLTKSTGFCKDFSIFAFISSQ